MSTATEEQAVAPADRKARIGLGVLAAGLSMIIVDGTIVGVSLPVIIGDLGLDLSDAQWINSVYSVVFAALLLTAGRLGDRLGRRRMFVLGVAVFIVDSLLAALATARSRSECGAPSSPEWPRSALCWAAGSPPRSRGRGSSW